MSDLELPVRKPTSALEGRRVVMLTIFCGVMLYSGAVLGKALFTLPLGGLPASAVLVLVGGTLLPVGAISWMLRRHFLARQVDVRAEGVLYRGLFGRERLIPWSDVRSALFTGRAIVLRLPGLGGVPFWADTFYDPSALVNVVYARVPWDRIRGDPSAMLSIRPGEARVERR